MVDRFDQVFGGSDRQEKNNESEIDSFVIGCVVDDEFSGFRTTA